jgi:hypothetical protein
MPEPGVVGVLKRKQKSSLRDICSVRYDHHPVPVSEFLLVLLHYFPCEQMMMMFTIFVIFVTYIIILVLPVSNQFSILYYIRHRVRPKDTVAYGTKKLDPHIHEIKQRPTKGAKHYLY